MSSDCCGPALAARVTPYARAPLAARRSRLPGSPVSPLIRVRVVAANLAGRLCVCSVGRANKKAAGLPLPSHDLSARGRSELVRHALLLGRQIALVVGRRLD